MTAHADSGLGTWAVSAAGAIVLTAATASLFGLAGFSRPAAGRLPPASESRITVRGIPPPEADFNNEVDLYRISRFSAAPGALSSAAIQHPGDAFLRPYDEKLTIGPATRIAFPPVAPTPGTPVEALAVSPQSAPYQGFGRREAVAPTPVARDALVQAVSLKDGTPVWQWKIENDTLQLGRRDWKPLEFIVIVGPTGRVGPPLVTRSSGEPAVDNFFQKYLDKPLRVGSVLDPGNYTIRVEP